MRVSQLNAQEENKREDEMKTRGKVQASSVSRLPPVKTRTRIGKSSNKIEGSQAHTASRKGQELLRGAMANNLERGR